MLSNGLRCYRTVRNAFEWIANYRMARNVFEWIAVLSYSSRCFRMDCSAIGWFVMLSNGLRCYRMVLAFDGGVDCLLLFTAASALLLRRRRWYCVGGVGTVTLSARRWKCITIDGGVGAELLSVTVLVVCYCSLTMVNWLMVLLMYFDCCCCQFEDD